MTLIVENGRGTCYRNEAAQRVLTHHLEPKHSEPEKEVIAHVL